MSAQVSVPDERFEAGLMELWFQFVALPASECGGMAGNHLHRYGCLRSQAKRGGEELQAAVREMAQQAKEDDLTLRIGAELQGQMALALGQAGVVEDLDHPGAAGSQRRMDTATRCNQRRCFLQVNQGVPQTECRSEALFTHGFVQADQIAGDEAGAGAGGARARLLELGLGAIHPEDAVAGASEVQGMLAGAAAQIDEARLGSFLQHLQEEGALPL